ncbi:MAG TPA: protein-export chaperone SecB [Thermotogota bacterium]|nr:protein-export chaperone SecB [Thermotogota bacterium]HPR95838.1 protein-export chaperone SecB [Thermotogota bacterium]
MIDDSIISKSKSVLISKRIYVEKMIFQRTQECSALLKFSKSAIEKNIDQIGENLFKCSLSVRMADKNDEANLEVTIAGIFEIHADLPEETKEVIIAKNTMSILFPYIRSQITLLTSQPEVEPVVLPAVNINTLLENID